MQQLADAFLGYASVRSAEYDPGNPTRMVRGGEMAAGGGGEGIDSGSPSLRGCVRPCKFAAMQGVAGNHARMPHVVSAQQAG